MLDFSIPKTTVVVNTQKQPALTAADRQALHAAHAYHFNAGGGFHVFGQACGNPECQGYWKITLHETDAEFRSAISRACKPELPCLACQRKGVTGPSITYKAKSSAGGNGGSGKGARSRTGQARNGNKRLSKAWIEARIKQLADMIANPGQTPQEQIDAWQFEQESWTLTLASYPVRKRKVA